MNDIQHQSQLAPTENKFHVGNGSDGKHYWITPPNLYAALDAEFRFDFDPCPYPLPVGFDGLTQPWGLSNYVNPPFGSILHQGKKKGPTAWARKAIAEAAQGKRVVMVYPIDKWVLMLLAAGAKVRNLGDVRWLATEDGSSGKGTGRHIACFILGGHIGECGRETGLLDDRVLVPRRISEVEADIIGIPVAWYERAISAASGLRNAFCEAQP